MSTVETPAPPRKDPAVEYVEYDKYIDRQVERTRRAVKLVDLTQSLLVLVIGLVAFLLTAAVLEHWVFAGGLSTLGRLAMFALLLGGLGYYTVRYVWPLLASSINPAYAAAAIEREHPTLKNSLLNFLLFRTHKQEMPAAVYEALEEQAAQRLSVTSVEDSIDRSVLVKLGLVLLGVIVAAAAYTSLSPKSSLATAARVLMPWANIAAPSRVRIENIEPGNTEVIQGETVTVTASVFGLNDDDVVEVSYDVVDGQRLDQRATMQPVNDAGKFTVTLPADGMGLSGIDQDLKYRVIAGDGRSIDYTIHVLTAPHIRVRSVHYDFPDYTGYRDRTVEGRGDIRAIEGTKVTVRAEANTDIDQAYIDLASDGKRDKRMKSEGALAEVELPLRLEGDRRQIKTSSYMLRYTSTEGLENHDPPQHSLEILPDYAPEIEVLEPEERTRDVRVNETVEMVVDGRDPDFALRTVTLKFVKQDGAEVHEQALLKDGRHKGRYDGKWDFTPEELNLKPGDVVEYWAEATDVRTPQANRTASDRKQFRIVGNPDQQDGEKQQGEGGGGEGKPEEGNDGEGESQDGNEGEGGDAGGEGEGQEGEGQEGEGAEGEGEGQQGEGSEGQGEQQQEGQNGGQNNSGQQNGEGQQQDGAGQEGGEMQEGGESGQDGERQADGESEEGEGQSQGEQQGGGSKSSDKQQGAEGGEPSEGADGAGGDNAKPVPNDGSHDSEAFEKFQKHLDEELRKHAEKQKKPNGGGESEGDPQNSQTDSGEGQADAQNDPKASGQKQASGQGEKQDNPAMGESQSDPSEGSGEPEEGDTERTGEPDGQEGTAEQREAEGSGADTKNDAPQSEGGEANDTKPEAGSESAGGEERNASGDPGAGNETESQGAPDAQEEMKQRDKTAREGEDSETDQTEPPTPGHSKHESDSQGEQGGDRAGGGEEGGGQDAPREGTGSAGQHSAADEGAGESGDQGPGETGQRGGDSQQADGETGKPGEEQGNGSQSREGQGDAQAQKPSESGQPGEQTTDQQGQLANQQQPNQQQDPSQQDPNQQNPNQQPPQDGSQQGGNQMNNGQPGGNDGSEGPAGGKFDGSVAEGDEANLEYTRKQTDLMLEELSDQLDEGDVDKEMLDDLGWSEEDLRRFVDRWNRLRAEAARPDAGDAKQELDARLRNLGETLGPKGGTRNRTKDDFRDLREGYSDKVPLKYRDRLKAYTEGVSRGSGSE
ncbi:hypothetical protein [Aeoliella sp.]|uniref:hypothetical protein n=1 Tax=Aeoliella sp. TaxID=2795800 RepID=UPI003CCC419F